MTNDLIIEQSRNSYVDIPAIAGGTVLALALSLVLVNFGSAIGLAVPAEFHPAGESAWASIVAIALWGIWIQLLVSFAGGYLAGRMRRPVAGAKEHEREMRDGAHGLLVWAAGTVAVAIAVGLSAAFAALVTDVDAVIPEKTPEIMDREHNAAIIFAFTTASTALVAAVASWWAATMGGDHRDNAIDHSHYVSFRKK